MSLDGANGSISRCSKNSVQCRKTRKASSYYPTFLEGCYQGSATHAGARYVHRHSSFRMHGWDMDTTELEIWIASATFPFGDFELPLPDAGIARGCLQLLLLRKLCARSTLTDSIASVENSRFDSCYTLTKKYSFHCV